MGFGAGDIAGLIWSHPIASVVVALLFTPPLFPIVVFFSPLLISTALVVLAMISMGSGGGDENGSTPGGYGHSHYKRDWHEQEEADHVTLDDDDGPLLNDDDRRLHNRRKLVASHDDGWLDTVKSWEETGRAWIDSVLHQEARKPSSGTLVSSAATETREVRFAQPISLFQLQLQPPPPSTPVHEESPPQADSAENVLPLEKEPVVAADDQARGPASSEGNRYASEISTEPDEGMVETPMPGSHNLRAFPVIGEEEKSKSSEDRGEDLRPKSKGDEEVPAVVPQVIGAKQQRKEDVLSEKVTVAREEVGSVAESNGDSSSDRTEKSGGSAAQELSTSSASGEGKSSPLPSAAERERRAEHHRTPSVAVTLSEKLNVPLEDIMSLLAGDGKPSSSGAAPFETSTSHDEAGWSSSDDEAARTAAKGEQTQPSQKSN